MRWQGLVEGLLGLQDRWVSMLESLHRQRLRSKQGKDEGGAALSTGPHRTRQSTHTDECGRCHVA